MNVNEPGERRDVGPFTNAAQALTQFDNWAHGMPLPRGLLAEVVIKEALLATSVNMHRFELDALETTHTWDPLLAQIVAGWIYRAYRSGRQSR